MKEKISFNDLNLALKLGIIGGLIYIVLSAIGFIIGFIIGYMS